MITSKASAGNKGKIKLYNDPISFIPSICSIKSFNFKELTTSNKILQ